MFDSIKAPERRNSEPAHKRVLAPISLKLQAIPTEEGLLEGYGSVFDVEDSYGDVVRPGAFKDSLAEWKARGSLPKMLWQHDPSQPIGKWDEMEEDGRGLRVRGHLLLSVSKARECHEMLKAGLIDGLSIGFRTIERSWNDDENIRYLLKVQLWEISVVTFPANADSLVDDIKNGEPRFKTIREFEGFLRDEGNLSWKDARAIAARGFGAIAPKARDESGDQLKQLLAAVRSVNSKL
jgi:HK97 family phage prohead protease